MKLNKHDITTNRSLSIDEQRISKTEQCGEIAWYQNILVKFQLKILGCDDFYYSEVFNMVFAKFPGMQSDKFKIQNHASLYHIPRL